MTVIIDVAGYLNDRTEDTVVGIQNAGVGGILLEFRRIDVVNCDGGIVFQRQIALNGELAGTEIQLFEANRVVVLSPGRIGIIRLPSFRIRNDKIVDFTRAIDSELPTCRKEKRGASISFRCATQDAVLVFTFLPRGDIATGKIDLPRKIIGIGIFTLYALQFIGEDDFVSFYLSAEIDIKQRPFSTFEDVVDSDRVPLNITDSSRILRQIERRGRSEVEFSRPRQTMDSLRVLITV